MAYINRNCGGLNGRAAIAKALQALYPMEAYGCLGGSERVDKVDVFSKNKVRVGDQEAGNEIC